MHPLLVTAAILFHEGKILLTKRLPDRPYPDCWEFPGGKLEADEEPRACLERELREELGIEAAVDEIYDVVYYRYPERAVLVLAYRCRWTGGEMRDIEVSEHRWVDPADVGTFRLLPADFPLAERLRREAMR